MKRKTIGKYLFAVIVSSFFITSCTNDVDLANVSKDMQLKGALTLPIASASATVEEIVNMLTNKEFVIEGDDVIWQQKDSIEFQPKPIEFLPKEFVYNTPAGVPIVIPANSQKGITINQKFVLNFTETAGTSDVSVDSVYINDINFKLKLMTNATFNFKKIKIDFSLLYPELQDAQGKKVKSSVTFSKLGEAADIRFANVVHRNKLGNSEGVKLLIESITVEAPAGGVTIQPSSQIKIGFEISKFDYKVAFGRFKLAAVDANVNKYKYSIPDAFDGRIKYLNPMIYITVVNNTGIEATYDISYVKAYVNNNPAAAIFADFNGSRATKFTINRVKKYGDAPMVSSDLIDKDNGGTYKFFDKDMVPNVMEYKYMLKVQAASSDGHPAFITPDAKLKVVALAKIPFHVGEKSYYSYKEVVSDHVGDSINYYLNSLEKEGFKPDTVLFRFKITNGLPVNSLCTMKFLDKSDQELVANPPLESKYHLLTLPKLDDDGKVLEAVEQNVDIQLTANQIEQVLRKTDKISFEFLFNSEDKDKLQHKLHLMKQNTLDIKLGLFVKGKHSLNK